MAKHERLRKESDVLFLLKRRPELQRVLRQLDLKLSPTGQLMPLPFDGCPFDGCPLPFDLREFIINPAVIRRPGLAKRSGPLKGTGLKGAASLKRTTRKRTKRA